MPSFTTVDWQRVINKTSYDPFEDDAMDLLDYETRDEVIYQLFYGSIQVAVIFLGGNDLKNDYNDIFNDTESANFFPGILQRLQNIHGFVRNTRAQLPIVVCTIPDVGATPNVNGTYNDPVKAASTRAKIAAFNQSIEDTFAPLYRTEVARIDELTDLVFDLMPFHLNGTVFTIEGDPENPPDRVFCRDDFHPNTVAQALIANQIIGAVNEFSPITSKTVTPFPDREILQNLLGLDPDQPYLDWVSGYSLTGTGPDDDDDRDGLPNLVEMTLGTRPDEFSSPLTGDWKTGLSWTPDPVGTRYARLFAEESVNLSGWTPVPEMRISENDGTTTVHPAPGLPSSFVRLNAEARP